MDYKGYLEVQFSDDEMALFYENKIVIEKYGLKENQYFIIKNKDGEVVDKYVYRGAHLQKVRYQIIDSDFSGKIKPRNLQQELAVDLLKNDDITIKLITGIFGSGKTMLLAAAAMEAIQKEKFKKIVWVRNNVQVKDTDPLGALPGSELDKMLPYVMPLADHCGGIEGIRSMIENGTLEVIPLGFLRGRSIRDSIIFSSEAENLTKEHIQLLIGRVDSGSNLWMDADFKQRDKTNFEKSAGLEKMIEKLSGEQLFGYVHLPKSERSKTAALADKLD